MNATQTELTATILFALAIIHTFTVKRFQHFARKFPPDTWMHRTLHLFGEVEVVFGLWSALLLILMSVQTDVHQAINYLKGLQFTEPVFVIVIMAVAATKPLIIFAENAIVFFAKILPLNKKLRFYCATLIIGPLFGSLITEPAAMTVTALILKKYFYAQKVSKRFQYITLGTLFVNVSLGGVLTHFAAPPILMVARKWHWDLSYMFFHFGWKAVIAIILNTTFAILLIGKECEPNPQLKTANAVPFGLTVLHLLTLILIVASAHQPIYFLGIFIFFLAIVQVTKAQQSALRTRESFLVGFFLAGLVVLGSLQSWWLEPLLKSMSELPLYLGSTLLTAFNDNAALTYLGSQVQGLSESMKYALVAGSVVGGGLTVIANAPNPAGFSLLQEDFGKEGISPALLFLGAFIPTLISLVVFWILPHSL